MAVEGRLELDAAFALWTAPVGFRVVEAPSGASVAFEVEGQTSSGTVRSRCVVVADADGVADPCRHEAISGSYRGVDGRGLWWSLEPDAGADYLAFDYVLRASVDGHDVGSAEISRSALPPDAVYGELPEPLVGYWFAPPAAGSARPVLVLGGSEGGVQSSFVLASLLAQEGFFAVALGYFGMEGLPSTLTDIPLEYFEQALAWITSHHGTDGPPAVIGGSRGGEAALLVASTFPESVGSVVSIAGAGPVWNGYDPTAAPGEVRFAWTLNGGAFPIPRVPNDDVLDLDLVQQVDGREVIIGAPGFSWFLDNVPDSVEKAMIPVERARGPILLVAGGEDHITPALRLARMTEERARRLGGPQVHVVVESRAGHQLGPPGDAFPPLQELANGQWLSFGGTKPDNAAAQARVWPQVLKFLGAG